MQEILQAAITPVNIVFTTLLVFVMMYWVTVLIGVLDIGSFDIDFDTDVDFDVDVDMDVDVDVDAHHEIGSGHGIGGVAGALHFFNFGRLPFMVIMSFLVLFMWLIAVSTNTYWGGGAIPFALAMFFPNLLVSLFVTKIVTKPLIPVFEHFDGSVDPVDYIGLVCTLLLPASSTQMGQAEVMLENNSPLLINVKVEEGISDPILKGEKAVVIKESPDRKYYLIKKVDDEF